MSLDSCPNSASLLLRIQGWRLHYLCVFVLFLLPPGHRPAHAQENAPAATFRKAHAASSPGRSQQWIDYLNSLPESERQARIRGYRTPPRPEPAPAPTAVPRLRPAPAPAIARATVIPAPQIIPRVASSSPARTAVVQPARNHAPAPSAVKSPPPAPKASAPASSWESKAAVQSPPPKSKRGTIEASPLIPQRPAKTLSSNDPGSDSSHRLPALLAHCEELSQRGLRYVYGSNDPRKGGLDCSGAVQYLLKSHGIEMAPRQANTQYAWLREEGTLRKLRLWTTPGKVFGELEPGDLLFWKGTYNVHRVPNVTHVMIYMGQDRSTGRHLMFGARSSRARGKHGHPVDIFDFDWPEEEGKGKFIAYGRVPGLRA